MTVVAPLAGAWIEMHGIDWDKERTLSLPSRERGLKSGIMFGKINHDDGRSPRGSVD